MIRIILLGRTGNNLFQYALGRALAKRHQVPLVLDGSWFNREGWREVSHFLRLQKHASVVRPLPLASRLLRKITGRHHWEFTGRPLVRETPGDLRFRQDVLEAPADCVLCGYFQSPRYFEEMADEIRGEINHLLATSIRPNLVQARLADWESPRSVAVHVRRGDYLLHGDFQVCNEAYYENAMERMRREVEGARFHIVSDDPSWCRERFQAADVEVFDHGRAALNPLHDLFLMSRARHHIIANSSYSWWAAWLGKRPGQKVIAPPMWFRGTIIAPIEEKLCDGWVTVSN